MPFSRLLVRPLPDISSATWYLGSLSKRHPVKDILPMRIYPYLSDRQEVNETDVKYVEMCIFQKVWDSCDSLNGNSCLIFIRSTIPVISGDFLTRWNATTVVKGRGSKRKKDNFELFHTFGYESFVKKF